jgi:hypothetical protein
MTLRWQEILGDVEVDTRRVEDDTEDLKTAEDSMKLEEDSEMSSAFQRSPALQTTRIHPLLHHLHFSNPLKSQQEPSSTFSKAKKTSFASAAFIEIETSRTICSISNDTQRTHEFSPIGTIALLATRICFLRRQSNVEPPFLFAQPFIS